jgi:hypothetical protein
MTTTSNGQDFTAAGTGYTITDAGTITLGRSTFRVEVQTYANGHHTTWLTGARGAVYFLRGFLGADTGDRQVISWKSGQALRVAGNEVRVVELGNVIEVAR